jgi:acetyl-CoA C-acetyltransferase
MDLFDVAEHGGSVEVGLGRVRARKTLVVGVETDFLFPIDQQEEIASLLERAGRDVPAVALQGVGWCADSGRVAERDLISVPHLRRAAADALGRAGVAPSQNAFGTWHLHDYTPDAELLAYAAVGLCGDGEATELALSGATMDGGAHPVSPAGGSLAGEAPFGGPLRKLLDAVRQLRGTAGAHQVPGVARSLVQIATGPAGQFQTVLVLGREAA